MRRSAHLRPRGAADARDFYLPDNNDGVGPDEAVALGPVQVVVLNQFDVQGETVEVLGPDGLHSYPRTLGSFETIMVNGGTQALKRTEQVPVSIGGAEPVTIRRPTLLGAILLKARAVASVKARRAEHREDLIRLLTFVHDPRGLADAGALTKTERKWLKAIASDVAFDDAGLLGLFSETQLEQARQAFTLLT